MLLTKRLITYDPEDALPVSHLQVSTLPETGPDTSCLDILNFFQEGKSKCFKSVCVCKIINESCD